VTTCPVGLIVYLNGEVAGCTEGDEGDRLPVDARSAPRAPRPGACWRPWRVPGSSPETTFAAGHADCARLHSRLGPESWRNPWGASSLSVRS